ncbi:hypothetical protein QFZ77_002954 [Paenibacillus sp. V4I3]|uniref:hypothetical protein n=1 Tax=Paenibacillus sp. V4I3 TaxID=3042305 RepID=UPI0027814958|nr:hypothetical protein [Paenibacillus sp. V4I3]MDQ0874295.1 hypothetical protein [Paenibacillus sp. V4I3]
MCKKISLTGGTIDFLFVWSKIGISAILTIQAIQLNRIVTSVIKKPPVRQLQKLNP